MTAESRDPRFCGPRLRVARLFNDLTQAELAARASITPQFVGHIEHGLKQPGDVVTEAIAEILGFDREFFFGAPLEEFRDEECHFRRRATTPVTVRTRALAHGSLFGALVAYLDDAVAMPPENIPHASIQTPEEVERAAELCRMKWGLGRDLPIKNLTRAVENAGIVVTRFAAESVKIDAFSRAGRRGVIVLNTERGSNARSRFDLGHETGHLVGHGGLTTGDTDTEKQADRFAGALLLPRAGFVREFPRPRSGRFLDWAALFKLKPRWGCSVSAMIKRAYELRLISAPTYQAAYKHIAYRGWIKNEPDDLPPELPELIPLCLEEVRRTRELGPRDVAATLGWSPRWFSVVSGTPLSEMPPTPPPSGKVVWLAHERAKRTA